MLPDFVTDQTKIAKYSYADIEEIFLDNYEDVLKKYIAGGNPSEDTLKITSARFVNFFPGARIMILNRCASRNHILFCIVIFLLKKSKGQYSSSEIKLHQEILSYCSEIPYHSGKSC